MNAPDRPIGRADERRCESCRHALAGARDGLYCGRGGRLPYPCEVERIAAPLEAWVYGACGRRGRFFEARALASVQLAHDVQRPPAPA